VKRSTTFLMMALVTLAACGSAGEAGLAPRMEIDPAALTVEIDEGGMEVGDERHYNVTILNTGNADLLLQEPVLEQSCGLYVVETDAAAGFPLALPPTKTKADGVAATVTYKKGGTACADRNAVLTLRGNDPATPRIDVSFKVVSLPPAIEADDVDFGAVPEGSTGEANLYVRNNGKGPLLVDRVTFIGSQGFSFQWPCERASSSTGHVTDWIQVTGKMGIIGDAFCKGCDVRCEAPVAVAGGKGAEVRLRFGAECDKDPTKKCPPEAEATMTLYSNDPEYDASTGEGKEVRLTANKGGRCIRALVSPLDFGPVVAPQVAQRDLVLFGCGDKDVTISSMAVAEANADPAQFSFAMPAGKKLPYVLKPNEQLPVRITYQAIAVRKDATGAYIEDTAVLEVGNDSPVPALKVPLVGLAVDSQCAVADFDAKVDGQQVEDGAVIAVQSTIKLKQDCHDLTPGGAIVSYEWKVASSTVSTESIQPGPLAEDVTYDANVVGVYDITLECCNKFGCCDSKTIRLDVPPPEGCHVELTWNTPLDPDQTDQCGANMDCGADMDLHVVHPAASGPDLDKDGKPDGFFDVGDYPGGFAGDCMWFNPNPCWVLDKCEQPDLQPHLDRDDTDGAGPENFTYRFAEPGRCYKVGVHYWDEHLLGKSYPTVRVWVDGEKVWESAASPKMSVLDMWEVGEVCCMDKAFKAYTTTAGGPVIIHNYVNPDFDLAP
jgi:hypothetical protein